MVYGYLGPPGTFTEEAAELFYQSGKIEGIPLKSNRDVIKAVD